MPIYKKKPNTGKHYFRRDGKMACIENAEVIECFLHELGGALDKFECLNQQEIEEIEEEEERGPEPEIGLRAVHRGHGRWDVIHSVTGEKINNVPLNKQEALMLV